MNGNTRYHAEIKLTIEDHEARINCFADTLAEIFQDIGTIASQFPPDWKNPALRDIINAERRAAQLNVQQPPKASQVNTKQPPAGKPADQIPLCQDCGTDEFMEMIEFADKKTGKHRKAWKCQQCGKWHWPPKNGEGR